MMYTPGLDREMLIERLRYSLTKRDVVQLAHTFSEIGIEPEELLELSINGSSTIGFHAAWVLENMLIPFPEALDYYLPTIINYLPQTKNPSVQRHLAKLSAIGIKRVIKRETTRIFEKELWRSNLEPLEECCFKLLVDDNTKPGVKVHCMDILFYLSFRQKWIAEELPYIIQNQMHLGSPALRARGKEIIKQVKKSQLKING